MVWLYFSLLFGYVSSSRVLFLPSPFFSSHAVPMKSLAETLSSKGHYVEWVEYSPKLIPLSLSKDVKRTHWKVTVEHSMLESLVDEGKAIATPWESSTVGDTLHVSAWIASIRICNRLLSNHKEKFEELISKDFDTVILDDQFNPCGLLLASLKGSVFVYWSQSLLRPESSWAHNSPFPPSYLPVPGTKYTDHMSFYERSVNLLYYLKSLYTHQYIIQPRLDAVFKHHYPQSVSSYWMERNASLNFVNSPPIFDFARPYMPRVVFVGCLHCTNSTSLPPTLSSFISSSPFIVVSFGFSSFLSSSPPHIRSLFFHAFSSRPSIKFIVQFDGSHSTPPNVLTLPFLPLQSLLNNPQCLAHISHGGLNSVVESVYHGVPVIGIPLLYPSHDNLLRISARGAGIIIEKKDLSAHSLLRSIDKIQKKRYKEEMLVFQDMVRDVPYSEMDHATFWIEFIERHHEIPHARSGADNLNVFQYFLIDVILFIVSSTFIFVYLSFVLLRSILRLFIASPSTKIPKKVKGE